MLPIVGQFSSFYRKSGKLYTTLPCSSISNILLHLNCVVVSHAICWRGGLFVQFFSYLGPCFLNKHSSQNFPRRVLRNSVDECHPSQSFVRCNLHNETRMSDNSQMHTRPIVYIVMIISPQKVNPYLPSLTKESVIDRFRFQVNLVAFMLMLNVKLCREKA